ncbi:hypothetical protein KSP35_13940 [Aquihabitans sp. G128]|uniref:hypothetical protein n=1 Tax=Aquihabitans sp. G128 TaxID=2849779 RepID=UPI001C248F36|nr:hypothetical protein [Aquihabitans sp. G128]QXC59494.1 hypothetical protein KSP35_13940 [Aquihabitans sp. G128]
MTDPSWPKPPREPGPWGGGPPVAPPGNTPLPPLPGPGGVSRTTAAATNPWANAESIPAPPPPPRAPFPGLDTASIPRIDRAPRWIVALAALVVLAVVAGGAYVVTQGGRKYPSEWDARVKPIADWVAKARKLDFDHPVEVQFLSEADYRARSTGGASAEAAAPSAEEQAQQDDAVAQLRALGLVEGKVDLGKANDTLSDTGTLAFYDPEVKKVFIRGTEMTPALRVTLAHELTHVLQDQHFDLERLADLPEDEAPVLRALAEGDAERIEDEYVQKVLTAKEREAYAKDSEAAGKAASDTIDKSVPPVLSALFQAPYIFGPELVAHLALDGGDLDKAFEDVPNEEVLFNPLIFGTPAAESDPLTVAAPSGTDKIEDGLFGPTTWYLMLASRLSPAVALKATDGLGGDGYVVYREKGTVCVQVHAAGDTPKDVEELAAALGDWVKGSPAGKASVETVDGQVRFRSCDPGDAAKGAGKVTPDLLVVPVTRTQVYDQVMDAGGASSEQATCYADAIVTNLSVEQLTSSTYVQSPEGAAKLQQLQLGCR